MTLTFDLESWHLQSSCPCPQFLKILPFYANRNTMKKVRQTDGRTNRAIHRAAWSQLKYCASRPSWIFFPFHTIFDHYETYSEKKIPYTFTRKTSNISCRTAILEIFGLNFVSNYNSAVKDALYVSIDALDDHSDLLAGGQCHTNHIITCQDLIPKYLLLHGKSCLQNLPVQCTFLDLVTLSMGPGHSNYIITCQDINEAVPTFSTEIPLVWEE